MTLLIDVLAKIFKPKNSKDILWLLRVLIILSLPPLTTASAQDASATTSQSSPPQEAGIYTLRKSITPQINTELSKAYSAFQDGNDEAAQIAYSNVLQQYQNNRDALLGLAALAWRSGDKRKAQQFYQKILQLYPQDTLAQVGLINSLYNRSPAIESQLKFLLAQARQSARQSAYIYFSLGKFYAGSGLWAQARQAFFNALVYDGSQADYAYNLAVSLDHLNQQRLALTYYQQTLQLAQNQPVVNFSPQAVQRRVQTIEVFLSSVDFDN